MNVVSIALISTGAVLILLGAAWWIYSREGSRAAAQAAKQDMHISAGPQAVSVRSLDGTASSLGDPSVRSYTSAAVSPAPTIRSSSASTHEPARGWTTCPKCNKPVKRSWPRCPNTACLAVLPRTDEPVESNTWSEDELARKLYTFYSLWGNEEKKKVVNVLARQYKVLESLLVVIIQTCVG